MKKDNNKIIEEFKALPYCQPPTDKDYLLCPSCYEKDFVCKGCASNWLIKALKAKDQQLEERTREILDGIPRPEEYPDEDEVAKLKGELYGMATTRQAWFVEVEDYIKSIKDKYCETHKKPSTKV